MGLDALPRSSLYYYDHHPDSRPTFLFSHSHSFHHASSYQTVTTTHGYCLGHVVSGQDDDAPPVGTDKATTPKPIDKFRAEVLPPKSARSIPITHHKLLSPIKSAKPRPWGEDDAARMMEAAARIIDPARIKSSVSGRTKVLLQHRVGSSSVPLKVRNLKEKSLQKQLKQQVVLEGGGGSRRKAESHPGKSLGGNSTNKGGLNNHSDGSSVVGVETKGGKSISLALLAKANVQRREGLLLCLNSSKSLNDEEVFKDQSTSSQNSLVKKQQSTEIESGVLRQNNQKQNSSIIDGGKKSPSKCSTKGGAKVPSGESASARHPYVGKPATTSKVILRNSGSEIRDDNTKATSSSTGRIARKKRSMDGKSLPEKSKPIQSIRKDKNGKATSVSSADTDRQRNWEQHGDGNAGTQVISFTFRSPMARPGPDSKRCAEVAGESGGKSFTSGSQSSMSPSTSDVSCASKYGVKGSDALSILLEQKLKELSLKVEFSQQKSEAESSHEGEHHQSSKMSSTIEQHSTVEEDSFLDENQVLEDFSVRDSKIISRGTKLLDCRLPSPVSVLEHFSSGDSCNSSDTTDSNSTEGSKQCSSIQMLDSCSLKTSISIELDGELSDSASSAFAGTIAKVEEDGTSKALIKNKWEPEYIKEILSNIEPMFMDYALGRSDEIISPHLFYQVGNRKLCSDKAGTIARTDDQRLIFDCVRECMDTRCKHYTCGGFKSWVKGVSMARQKDRLAEEVYKEISDWRGVGDSMIDELVDQDMSSRHGKWFNYDREVFELGMQIESCLVNSLVREAVADMLGL